MDTHTAGSVFALVDAHAGTLEDDVKVHAVDTDLGVVLDAEVDVFLDTETKVTGRAEVVLRELVLLHLEALLEDLGGLGATDGRVDTDLLVSTDTEGSDGVSGYNYKNNNDENEMLVLY